MPPPRLTKELIAAQARFISESKARIGKCVTFGCSTKHQFQELSHVLRMMNRHWRRLLAGREGYIAFEGRAGLYGHRVAWGDQDAMGHVNNVVYNRWAESARINWARNFALHLDPKHKRTWEELWTPAGIGLILRSIKTDYKFPLRYPDRITVLHKLLTEPKEGMDALHLEAVVLSETHQRIAARITEDIAVYDYRIGKKAPLPPFVIQSLRQIWQEQEKEVTRSMSEIFSLSGRISAVEKETWDRQDAVEDLGSAGASGNAMNTKQKKDADMLADLGVSVDPVDEKSGSGERDSDETPLEFEVMKKAG